MPEQNQQRPLRVFIAGATGAIGQVLVPKLVSRGYDVSVMTRDGQQSGELALGATRVVCDVFDAGRLREVVAEAKPDVVINQLTQLPKSLNPKKLGEDYAKNDRIRREGTANLFAAALAAGARRYIGQSGAYFYAPVGGMVKDEQAPLWAEGPSPYAEAVAALKYSEDIVLEAPEIEGVVLRYGTFYGPGTWYSLAGDIGRQMSKGRFPIIGSGEGVTSFIHIDDAADVCAAFVERGEAGIYNVADNEPATANVWMPVFAESIGAKRPRRVPSWLANLIAGKAVVEWATTSRGAANAKLKRELGWQPQYPSWRRGFMDPTAR